MSMRRDRIVKAVNNLKEALNAAQIRDLLRVARSGQQGEGGSRTQRILIAYNTFSQHHKEFSADEKQLMTFFGLDPLLDVAFWSNLIEGEQSVSRKLLSEVDVGAYNVTFVMPKLRDLLTQDGGRDTLSIDDSAGAQHEMKRLRIMAAETEQSLSDPSAVIAIVRSMSELYDALSSIYGATGVNLAIGAIDSGGGKTFDFYGAAHVMEALDDLFANVSNRVRHGAEDNIRHQIEMGMMTSAFVAKVKEAQNSHLVSDDQGQRLTRLAAKAIETLLRNGGYMEDMEGIHDVKASQFLTPRLQPLEYQEEPRVDSRRDDIRDAEIKPGVSAGLAANGAYAPSSISTSSLNDALYHDSSLNGGLNGNGFGGGGLSGGAIGGDSFSNGLNSGGPGHNNSVYGSSAYGSSPQSGGVEPLYRPQSSGLRDYRNSRDPVKDLKDIFDGS
jgi:hypothetical protein